MSSENKPQEVPEGFRVLTEGKANILYHIRDQKADTPMPAAEEIKEVPIIPEKAEEVEEEKGFPIKNKRKRQKPMNADEKNENRDTVFYNPVQEFNRDISILSITEFGSQLQKVSRVY
jgi:hypothetical protein